jgi:hypothetical protein
MPWPRKSSCRRRFSRAKINCCHPLAFHGAARGRDISGWAGGVGAELVVAGSPPPQPANKANPISAIIFLVIVSSVVDWSEDEA